MIRFRDAAVLAVTKLRTRRIRTIVTVGISGLLFAVLVGALVGFQGAVNSVNSFNKNGFSGRYIVSGGASSALTQDVFENPQIMARAQEIRNQTIADKKAAAKKLKLSYDPTTEPAAVMRLPGRSDDTLSFLSPAAQQAMQEYSDAHPGPGLADLKRVTKPYHATAVYSSAQVFPGNGSIGMMPGGQEVFPTDPNARQNPNDIFTQNAVALMPQQLTAPFLLPNSTWKPQSDAIPMLVPYGVATKLLGLAELPHGASADVKLARIRELNRKAAGATVYACYRNAASGQLIQTAISTADDIAEHAGDKKYQKPDLIYSLPPADSCGAAVVSRDVRTKAQKQTDANQETFNEQFNIAKPADQQKLQFQIVGLVPDPLNAPSNSAAGIVQGLLGSSLSGEIAIPQNLYDQLPSVQRYNSILGTSAGVVVVDNSTYYAEFASAGDARAFINQKSCSYKSDGSCSTFEKPFNLSAYGSNSIGLKDVEHKFNSVLYIAAIVVVAIAVVIMTGTVGRMLADSRRETAVFRAIGANRLDIVMVYGLYTLLLSLMIAAASLALGLVVAKIGDLHLWKRTTVQAKLAFGGADTTQAFHFFGYSMRVWLVAAAAVGAGLLGMILPLLRNIRRNPIKDMREE